MEKTDVIIVLGHRLLPGDQPSEDLKKRIDRAVELWKETGAPLIMPCGGLTWERTRTEAEVMKEMLMERGVPEAVIQLEDKSRITLENMTNAFDLVGPDRRVAIVSSDYHMEMAMADSEAAGLNAYFVGAVTEDEGYREEMRARLRLFGERIRAMRAQGMDNRQIIQTLMERLHPAGAEKGAFTIGQMMDMQKTMYEKYHETWAPFTVRTGKEHILWMISEIGEVIDIIKKNGDENACTDPALRAHLVEELVDVLMFYNDVLICYGITEEELKEGYLKKFQRNMVRW